MLRVARRDSTGFDRVPPTEGSILQESSRRRSGIAIGDPSEVAESESLKLGDSRALWAVRYDARGSSSRDGLRQRIAIATVVSIKFRGTFASGTICCSELTREKRSV